MKSVGRIKRKVLFLFIIQIKCTRKCFYIGAYFNQNVICQLLFALLALHFFIQQAGSGQEPVFSFVFCQYLLKLNICYSYLFFNFFLLIKSALYIKEQY